VSDLLPASSMGIQSVIKPAEQLTIKLRGVMVVECKDKHKRWFNGGGCKDTNDLIIVSKYQFGAEPMVERLHFFSKKVPIGWYGNFFDDIVFSTDDLKATSVKLQVQVYDVDDSMYEGGKESLSSLVDSVGAAYPILSVFALTKKAVAPAAFAVLQGANSIINLIDGFNEHDRLVDQSLILQSAEPGTAHSLLQPGYFVCFSCNVDEELNLDSELRVVKNDGISEFQDCNYAVLEVSRTYELKREQQLDQKAAKLMSELSGKGNSGKAALEFLRETINGYDIYRTMQKTQMLMSKEKELAALKKDLSAEEKQLLNRLKNKLKEDPVAKKFFGSDEPKQSASTGG